MKYLHVQCAYMYSSYIYLFTGAGENILSCSRKRKREQDKTWRSGKLCSISADFHSHFSSIITIWYLHVHVHIICILCKLRVHTCTHLTNHMPKSTCQCLLQTVVCSTSNRNVNFKIQLTPQSLHHMASLQRWVNLHCTCIIKCKLHGVLLYLTWVSSW